MIEASTPADGRLPPALAAPEAAAQGRHAIVLADLAQDGAEPWARFLESHGFDVLATAGAAEALEELERHEAALIVVQLIDPGHEGLAFCQSLADRFEAPILVLGRSSDALDRVTAIEFGADDYLSRSSHPLEILAKVRALVRRAERRRPLLAPARRGYRFAGLWFHPETRELVGPRGEVVKINRSEGALLTTFLEHPGEALTRARVMEMMHVEAGLASRSIDVRVGRLRRKLRRSGDGVEVIRTIHGAGYALCAMPVMSGERPGAQPH